MTIQEALSIGRRLLRASVTPSLDARLLLQHVLKVNHAFLVAHSHRPMTEQSATLYRELIERAAKSEPIPYLIGLAPFFGFDFEVGPDVLIPRPETEQLVTAAITWIGERKEFHIVDVGTGSGCIAVTLAIRYPGARIEAVDVSFGALEIAQRNARRHGVSERIQFHHGKLLKPIRGNPDLVIANLPYVTDHEWTTLGDGVKWYEPDIALRGGSDGLDYIRKLVIQTKVQLAAGGAVFLEVGWQHGQQVQQLAKSTFPLAKVTVRKDFDGHDRIISITT